MLTAFLVLMSVMVVFAAGEAVRRQCRRMLGRPLTMPLGAHETVGSEVHA
jgi:hypothetical protein